MKNHRKYIIVLLFLFTINSLNYSYSQTEGYYGKRFSIGLDAKVSPVILNPNYKLAIDGAEGEGFSHFYYNLIPALRVQYVLTENRTLGLNIGSFKTSHRYFTDHFKNKNFPIVDAKFALFDLRFYNGYLAPIGKFHKLNTGLIFTSTDIADIAVPNVSKLKLGYPNNFTYFSLGFGFGKSYVLFDRVLIDRSFDFCAHMPLNDMPTFFGDFDDLTEDKKNHRRQHYRMLALTSFMFNLSVSLLAF